MTDQVGSNDGTLIHNAGFSTNTPDGSANSLDLSATGTGADQDYVRLGDAAVGDGTPPGRDLGIAATNSLTIAGWVNYTASQRGIVTIKQDLTSGGGDRSGVTFGMGGGGEIFVGMIASSGGDDAANGGPTFRDITTDQIVPTGEWHHFAMTYDNSSDTLVTYLDGAAATTYTASPAGTANADGTNVLGGVGIDFVDGNGSFTGFGASGNGPAHGDSAGDFTRLFYDGLLDDVGLWDNAIPASSVALLAGGATPPQVPVPEPTSGLIMMLGLAAVVTSHRRRR